MSFPLRERGLKLSERVMSFPTIFVVPLAGTWIETFGTMHSPRIIGTSFPLRERGLKLCQSRIQDAVNIVVPLAGTWIETLTADGFIQDNDGRSPCGNVD